MSGEAEEEIVELSTQMADTEIEPATIDAAQMVRRPPPAPFFHMALAPVKTRMWGRARGGGGLQ